MPELITDPAAAKAALEIDMNAPATKADVARYVDNYFKINTQPFMQQQNMIAGLVNLLMDFLTQRGLGNSNNGKYYLNTAEWNEYVEMRKKVAAQKSEAEANAEKLATQAN